MTSGACPFGRIEAEAIGLSFLVCKATFRAHQMPAEMRCCFLVGVIHDEDTSFAHLHGGSNGLLQSITHFRGRRQSINDHVNVMGFVAIQFQMLGDFNPNTINPCPEVALFCKGFKAFAVMPLTTLNNG